jgi:hypothetical protein
MFYNLFELRVVRKHGMKYFGECWKGKKYIFEAMKGAKNIKSF